MSGYAMDVLLKEGDLAPGTDLLNKSFNKYALACKVREVLDKRPLEGAVSDQGGS
jgi:hypothetical protein